MKTHPRFLLSKGFRLFAVNLSDLFLNDSEEIALSVRVYVRNLSDTSRLSSLVNTVFFTL